MISYYFPTQTRWKYWWGILPEVILTSISYWELWIDTYVRIKSPDGDQAEVFRNRKVFPLTCKKLSILMCSAFQTSRVAGHSWCQDFFTIPKYGVPPPIRIFIATNVSSCCCLCCFSNIFTIFASPVLHPRQQNEERRVRVSSRSSKEICVLRQNRCLQWILGVTFDFGILPPCMRSELNFDGSIANRITV